MDEFNYKKTYFVDEEFDFESIMREFGSEESYDDLDYGDVGTIHFGLDDDDDGILSAEISSEDEEPYVETLPETEAEPEELTETESEDDYPFPEETVVFTMPASDDEDEFNELSFDDTEASPASYSDADIDYEEEARRQETKARRVRRPNPKPESFREAVINPIIGALAFVALKIKHSKITFSAAMADEDEDLGAELPPEKAAKFYDSHIHGLRLRARLAFIFSLVLIYLTYGLPVPGALSSVGVKSAVITIILLTVMLCGLDIITEGLMALAAKKPNANTLISLSAVFCVIDGFIASFGGSHHALPFSVIPAITLSFSISGAAMNCRSCRAALNTVAVTAKPLTVSSETSAEGDGITVRKAYSGKDGFVRRTEEAGPDESAFGVIAPFLIVIIPLLSIIAAAVSHSFSDILHILSGIFVFAAPAAMLICYPLPALLSALSLGRKGSAIAGWSGLYDISKCRHVVITDSDLFPRDSVKVSEVRIFAGAKAERVLSLVGSITAASGSVLAPAFAELMERGKGRMLPVENFECHDGGGFIAMVDGTQVFCGSAGFMHLCGVHLPDKYKFRDCIYVSENRTICGMFMMEYKARDSVKDALATLMSSEYHPIFALRDFNLTPRFLSVKFDIATDGFDFPSFSERYGYSEEELSESRRPSAIVSREGLGVYVDLAEHAKNVYNRVRLCVMLSVLTSVIGIIIMFAAGLSASLSATSALTYALISLIPVIITALSVKT